MLKIFLLSYIGKSIGAGFWYYVASFALVITEIIAGVYNDRDRK